ncbi:hypothetical protein DH2020_023315 [Rehmannia glutinosa]|uniref:RNase H type-1 domain-containing protein n=1 Tax=Rehmannia glutinosa TaxID=99300 RepID=A0ABR0W5P8_REHGL
MESNMANLSLFEDEDDGLVFDTGIDGNEYLDGILCLVGEFISERNVNFNTMKQRMVAIWRPVKDVEPPKEWGPHLRASTRRNVDSSGERWLVKDGETDQENIPPTEQVQQQIMVPQPPKLQLTPPDTSLSATVDAGNEERKRKCLIRHDEQQQQSSLSELAGWGRKQVMKYKREIATCQKEMVYFRQFDDPISLLEEVNMNTVAKISMILWNIWKQRNSKLWKNTHTQSAITVQNALSFLEMWSAARICSQDPGAGWFMGDISVFEGESRGLLEGLNWIRNLGFSDVIFEIDAKGVIDVLDGTEEIWTEVGRIIRASKDIINSVPSFRVQFTPDISGERQSGQDVRAQNVMACQAVANIVKSSLGPVGLDKISLPYEYEHESSFLMQQYNLILRLVTDLDCGDKFDSVAVNKFVCSFLFGLEMDEEIKWQLDAACHYHFVTKSNKT